MFGFHTCVHHTAFDCSKAPSQPSALSSLSIGCIMQCKSSGNNTQNIFVFSDIVFTLKGWNIYSFPFCFPMVLGNDLKINYHRAVLAFTDMESLLDRFEQLIQFWFLLVVFRQHCPFLLKVYLGYRRITKCCSKKCTAKQALFYLHLIVQLQ